MYHCQQETRSLLPLTLQICMELSGVGIAEHRSKKRQCELCTRHAAAQDFSSITAFRALLEDISPRFEHIL